VAGEQVPAQVTAAEVVSPPASIRTAIWSAISVSDMPWSSSSRAARRRDIRSPWPVPDSRQASMSSLTWVRQVAHGLVVAAVAGGGEAAHQGEDRRV